MSYEVAAEKHHKAYLAGKMKAPFLYKDHELSKHAGVHPKKFKRDHYMNAFFKSQATDRWKNTMKSHATNEATGPRYKKGDKVFVHDGPHKGVVGHIVATNSNIGKGQKRHVIRFKHNPVTIKHADTDGPEHPRVQTRSEGEAFVHPTHIRRHTNESISDIVTRIAKGEVTIEDAAREIAERAKPYGSPAFRSTSHRGHGRSVKPANYFGEGVLPRAKVIMHKKIVKDCVAPGEVIAASRRALAKHKTALSKSK